MMVAQTIRWQQRFNKYRKALEMGLIDDRRWMETIEDRNLASHFYEKESVTDVCCKIKALYNALFVDFAKSDADYS